MGYRRGNSGWLTTGQNEAVHSKDPSGRAVRVLSSRAQRKAIKGIDRIIPKIETGKSVKNLVLTLGIGAEKLMIVEESGVERRLR
jgi:hypothetical protein